MTKSIMQQQSSSSSIFIVGNLVQYKHAHQSNFVLMVLESEDDADCFKGVVVYTEKDYFVGDSEGSFSKGSFVQFNGKITLEA